MKDALATLYLERNILEINENIKITNQIFKDLKEITIINLLTWKNTPSWNSSNIYKVLFFIL